MSRKTYDKVMKTFTYLASSFTALILLAIITFTFTSGTGLVSMDLIKGDYYSEDYSIEIRELEESDYCYCDYEGTLGENTFYSEKWGIALSEVKDTEGLDAIQVTYIDSGSPFLNAIDRADGSYIMLKTDSYLLGSFRTDIGYAQITYGAESMIGTLEGADEIWDFGASHKGGGIQGSIVTTMILIASTLAIVVPFGVLTAIYMNEYTSKNKLIKLLETMIDTLTGVPSIIFGLLGAAVFVPMVNNMSGATTNFGSILAGAMTMSVILLPVIVKTTTQALNQVPKDLRRASYALGATKTQTTFKVVLGNSIPGIVSGIILGIGRIVGESAALIFAMGTLISDNPNMFDRSTSLAVHIWTVMAGDHPNFELASAIALIILVIVLSLNVTVKLITKRFNKMGRA